MSGRTVLIMAGGTGGHVFPALAVAERLRADGVEVVWMGTRAGLEARVIPAAGIEMEWVSVAGLRGKGLLRLLAAPLKLIRALLQALAILRRRTPCAVLGMGGFVTGPGGVAARLLGVPLLIHEQNSVAGLTNRLLSRIASRVMEAFPGSLSGAQFAGNPVRGPITAVAEPAARLAGRSGRPRLLVVGGSLGAASLNQTVPLALAALDPDKRPEVWHQTGSRNLEEAETRYRAAGVAARVVPFIESMEEAYGWADLVLCRAGALTVAELAAVGVASLLVPYPHAVDDHQTGNARFLSEAGAARLLPQPEFTAEGLAGLLHELCGDRPQLLAMAEAARRLGRPDATERVARECLAACGGEL
ncbi:undecaprenyldiphospho-muramoylpentapeptide beta-N-acetylglucosaminyltransferase [Endothiovibrio diazotrophicus]